MQANDKKGTIGTRRKPKGTEVIVDQQVGNYEKHPFFVKKAKAAKALLLEVGLPSPLTNKKKLA